MGLIFASFANFGQIREIKSARKVLGSTIRENKYYLLEKLVLEKYFNMADSWKLVFTKILSIADSRK